VPVAAALRRRRAQDPASSSVRRHADRLLRVGNRDDAHPGRPTPLHRQHPQQPAARRRSAVGGGGGARRAGKGEGLSARYGHLVAGTGQPAEGRHHEAADRLVRAGRQRQPGPLGEVGQVEPAVHLGRPARRQLGHHVVPVVDLADQLLDQVLQGDDAGGAPVLVDHHREVVPLPAHLREGGEDPLGAGHLLDLPGQLADGVPEVVLGVQEHVPQVYEADHVVVGAVDHRIPAVGVGPDEPGRLRQGQPGGQEDHLGPGHHDLADHPGPRDQHLVDDPPFDRVEQDVGGDQVAQLPLADLLPAGGRAGSEQGGHQSGRGVRGPHDDPGQAARQRAGLSSSTPRQSSPGPGTSGVPHGRDGRHRGRSPRRTTNRRVFGSGRSRPIVVECSGSCSGRPGAGRAVGEGLP